ncbi:glycerophosphodiester phosphodiesterase family protein [Streptomyces cynarae]|uniref:Glycerophosphodiester phosphodiesterase family protein n=1 Tax=Streptomyces cynarae TaxID=2981134 RepID=A0ABY6DXQ2_9ACTN|nr:glycerophosphodiester phosphodiesterase family protein [Streptomyces cynarae]UXY19174.1 glycerophosphodiester phosphodiesterase family protein [Streptomyces cynarae]
MYARVAAATITALFGLGVAILPTPHARASGDQSPVVIAHRGASAYAPENTLAAVDKAAAMGFRWVENDVQRTKDGRLVVIHDATLERTTDVKQLFPDRSPWRVKDFTAEEIAHLDAGSWFGPRYTGARVPTLQQYMERVSQHHQSLLLEIKNPELYPGVERQILKLLGNEGWLDADHLRNRLIVQSFSADSVRMVHDLRPGITTAYLGTPPTTELPLYARFADQINSSQTKLSAGYVSAVHALNGPHDRPMKVFAWNVDTAEAARRVCGFGVDGIITNAPDVVQAVIGAH